MIFLDFMIFLPVVVVGPFVVVGAGVVLQTFLCRVVVGTVGPVVVGTVGPLVVVVVGLGVVVVTSGQTVPYSGPQNLQLWSWPPASQREQVGSK